MKNCLIRIFPVILFFVSICASAQVTDSIHYNYGIWQTFGSPISRQSYPEIKGRLCNFRWADLETSPNVWDWSDFDYQLSIRAQDSTPIIFMVYTKEDAPDWLFTNGVPKVMEYDVNGQISGYSPYYADPEYKTYFKRMISTVRQHVETLPTNVRMQIVAVQACFGSTGDYISYKGSVPTKYFLSDGQFNSLFQEFSLYYYNEYKNFNPKIYLLSNPSNSGASQMKWLIDSCPGGWIKTGSLGKGYQLNDEVDKASWLFNILNYPQNGEYVRARCEITGESLFTGWWNTFSYRNMYALMCYDIHWGLDWSNQANQYIFDHNYDSAFNFYNRYAGQKVPQNSNYAMCALKDVIDASDTERFPASIYGPATRTSSRFKNVLTTFAPYGARLDDTANAILSENDNLNATGINDVGWNLFAGNYERFLHQIKANETSVGYWNVNSRDTASMYGRFARGFDVNNNKYQLFFDVDSLFLNNKVLNGAYPVMIDIVYLDSGTGTWQLFYDAKIAANRSSIKVTCTNTGLWKKATVTLTDAYFGNRGLYGSDFSIRASTAQNVIFSVVELSRPNADLSGIGFSATPITQFDTLCINSISKPKTFTVSGAFLTGSTVTVGPLKGFKFSENIDGIYKDSIIISNIAGSFSKQLFIKFYSGSSGNYSAGIPVKGGGVSTFGLPVIAAAVNSSPALSANVNTVTCFNAKNGGINLIPSGGTGPFSYNWSNNTNNFKSTAQDINNLIPSLYTVIVRSQAGCITSASYNVTQPDPLNAVLSYDPVLCKGGFTNLYVNGSGGTTPYTGTGTYIVSSGLKNIPISDAHGCTDNSSVNIPNGIASRPDKPGPVSSQQADLNGVCAAGDYNYSISKVANSTFYNWYSPDNSAITATANGGLIAVLTTTSSFAGGSIAVAAGNECGTGTLQTKVISLTPARPSTISGPATVSAKQSGLTYSVPNIANVNYTWTLPTGATINSGQGTYSIKVTWGFSSGNVKVTASNDCGASGLTTYFVTVANGPVAQQEEEPSSISLPAAMMVFPNPAHDLVNINFDAEQSGDYKISIADLTGRTLQRNNYPLTKGNINLTLDIKSLSNGVYMINVFNANGKRKTVKLIKN